MGIPGRLALSGPREGRCAIAGNRGSVSPYRILKMGHFCRGSLLVELDDISHTEQLHSIAG